MTTPFPARSFRCALLGAGRCRVMMGHLGIGLFPSSQLRWVGCWQHSYFKFRMLRPKWRGGNKRIRPSSVGLPLRLVGVSSEVASSREKTSDWTPSRPKFSSGAAAPRAAILAVPAHFSVATHSGSSRHRQNFGCHAGSKHGQGARHVLMPILKLGMCVEHGRPPDLSQDRCSLTLRRISCGVHDKIDRRRTKLGQLPSDPCHQYDACYLRRGIMSNHS